MSLPFRDASVIAHCEGAQPNAVEAVALGEKPRALNDDDVLILGVRVRQDDLVVEVPDSDDEGRPRHIGVAGDPRDQLSVPPEGHDARGDGVRLRQQANRAAKERGTEPTTVQKLSEHWYLPLQRSLGGRQEQTG